MTRTEFVQAYAARSGLDAQWAILGFVGMGSGYKLVAMPCDCGDEGCEGWAMISGEQVSSHLSLHAPEPLRSAYLAAIRQSIDNMIF